MAKIAMGDFRMGVAATLPELSEWILILFLSELDIH